MEAQRLLGAAPLEPDIVKVLNQAFEKAWASIAPTIATNRASDNRVSLAQLSLMRPQATMTPRA